MRKSLLYLLVVTILSACGSPPLVLPESANPTEEMATTSEIFTSTEVMKQTVTPESLTPTVTLATSTPVTTIEQSIIVATEPPAPIPPPTLYPTPALSPTPTPTFEPLSDKPIGGYVFSPPELILETDRPLEIAQWLPDSNEELLIRSSTTGKFTIEIFNIKTGDRKRLVETDSLIGNPVWLPATRQVAYLSQNETDGRINLFLSDTNSGAQEQSIGTQTLSNVSPPLVPAPDGASVLVFDAQMSRLQSSGKQAGQIQSLTIPEPLPIVEGGPFARYQAAWSDKTDWVAYYNPEKFMLINLQTGESQIVDFGKGNTSLTQFWATYAIWSPDGQKLAVVITSDHPSQTITFTQLAIFDPSMGNVTLIDDNFAYVTNVIWAADNNQTLISGVIGQRDGYDVEALFLVNNATNKIESVPVMPDNALGLSFFSSLAWSPDGKQIIVGYAEQPGKVGWYRVTVKKP